MAKSAVLNVSVLVDAAKAAAGLAETTSKFEGFAKDMTKAVAGAFAVDKIKDFVVGAIGAASDLNETMSKSATIFGKNADEIDAWGSTAADAMGLSKEAAVGAAAGFGNFFQQIGIGGKTAVDMSKSLVGLASDFASFNNLDTADALDAIQGALRGEYDSLQRMVPTINAAAVEHEALAESGKSTAKELTDAEKATATYQLILKGAGSAAGDFAKTSEGLANSQRIMNAHWEDSQAAIGQAFLPAMTTATNLLSNVAIPVITAVGTAIGAVLQWVVQLPAPLFATAAAFAAWQIITSVTAGVSIFTTVLVNLRLALLVLSAGIKTFFASIGPVGWAILAVGAAVTVLTMLMGNNEEQVAATDDRLQKWLGTLDQTSGAVTDATRAMIAQDLAADGTLKRLEAAGISAGDYINAMLGVAGASDKVAAQAKGSASALAGQDDALKQTSEMALQAGVSQETLNAAIQSNNWDDVTGQVHKYVQGIAQTDTTKATAFQQTFAASLGNSSNALGQVNTDLGAISPTADAFSEKTGEMAAANNAAAEASTKAGAAAGQSAEEIQKAAKAAAQAAVDTNAVSVALDQVSTASKQASDAVDFFVISMNAASGISPTMDQAAQQLNASIRDTSAAFKDAAEKGGINSAALTTWNVAALTATEQGDKLYGSLTDMQTAYATSTTAAYTNAGGSTDAAAGMAAAAAAADNAYNQFINMATGAGMGSSQAAELAAKLGIVQGVKLDPKTFEVIGDKAKADAALAAVNATTVDPKTVQVDANVKPATDVIAATTAGVPDATIKAMANTKPADAAIKSTATANYQATVETQANITPAATMVNQFVGLSRTTTVQVNANTSSAINAINAVTSWVPGATIRVGADTGPARQAIDAVTSGHYTATIVVTANVSQATAAIAAIPRSVGVSAPPPAAPAGFAAPRLMLSSTGAPSGSTNLGTGTVNIKIEAGVGDPDAIARTVSQVMRTRDRRAGGIRVMAI